MYVKSLQLANYGPIRDLYINFPFDGPRPKPVLLVGENGSGKTIALSHIVNAIVQAKDAVFHESRELDSGKVLKLRSSSYISVGTEYYYAQTDFESELFTRELRLRRPKHEYVEPPMEGDSKSLNAWEAMTDRDGIDYFDTNLAGSSGTDAAKDFVLGRCLLYFPSNRAEEPAWLNQANLRAKPQYSEGSHLKGESRRKLIARSPLRDLHDWLYDVAYDRAAFEMRSESFRVAIPSAPNQTEDQMVPLPLFLGYRGDATNAYNLALAILRVIVPDLAASTGLRFGIGGRHNRVISIESDQGVVVPNLFQLSSGETALLSLFLSILRDFDLRETRDVPFQSAEDIKGLVVVDEIDLHLHSMHQFDILPKLVHMFPNVQFVMTSHSPLFVLGMAKMLGEDGFHVYDLPTGSRVAPEDFDEFGRAFLAFKSTSKFSVEVRAQIQEAQRPILFVEGSTDKDYLLRAAHLLEKTHILDRFDVQDVGGEGQLKTIWNSLKRISTLISIPAVVILHDPESKAKRDDKGAIHKWKMPYFEGHPISKGIENLFERTTLERTRQHGAECFDIDPERTKTERGKDVCVPESWSVNKSEKRNLCNWLCEHGVREDFRHFEGVFEELEPLARQVALNESCGAASGTIDAT